MSQVDYEAAVASCPDRSTHGNPFRYCASCPWTEVGSLDEYTPPVGPIDLGAYAATMVMEIDRLWPEETSGPAADAYRAQCLAEEAGEVSRAITKRRHARNAPDGLCKGKTAEQWTGELHVETAQLIGVALDILHREGANPAALLLDVLTTLQRRERGT